MPKVTRHDPDEENEPDRGLLDDVDLDDYDESLRGHDQTALAVGDVVGTPWGAGTVLKLTRNGAKIQLDAGGEPLVVPLTQVVVIDVVSRLADLAREGS